MNRGPLNPETRRAKAQAAVRRQFAELLAEGARAEDAAVRMGFVPQYGRNLLAKLRKDLGAQAV